MPITPSPSPPSSTLVDVNYRILVGLRDDISTFDLHAAAPEQYAKYCDWHEGREDARRLSGSILSIEGRLAAYLRLVGRKGRRFHLGTSAIPSSAWLREHLDIHRNTMTRYIKDAKTVNKVQLSLNVACQLAFAASIYPSPTKVEKAAKNDPLESRLDLINDYHLTGRNKASMVRRLTSIVYTGINDLFTVTKTYPCAYNRDPKGQPVKRMSEHTPRKVKRRAKPAAADLAAVPSNR
ncbi:hypothetical protein [Neorhodopirellula lusitana]|uniref:hypothetical protein n=1 Tax=Neorhodopirellula lusitana TaxID=445327 RepID=UPI0038504F5E